MEYLLFDLIQNFHGEYPKFSPYMVIKLAEKGKERKGFGTCSELGKTNYLACAESYKHEYNTCLFRPFDEDTEFAFIGEIVIKDGLTFFKIIQEESYKGEIDRLIKEYAS